MSDGYLSPRYREALIYAFDAHAEQARKGPAGIPYISHPLAVSSLILEAGGSEDEAIAGLLHDVAEDAGGETQLTSIAEKFGPAVAEIVHGCSDSLVEDPAQKAPWRERKEDHLRHLEEGSDSVVIVTAADKLHNARALVEDLHADPTYLRHFNPDADVLWYYRAMLATLQRRQAPRVLLDALGRAVDALEALINPNADARG